MDGFRKRVTMNIAIIASSFLLFGILLWTINRSTAATVRDITAGRQVIAERAYTIENISKLKQQQPEAEVIRKKIDAILPRRDELISFQNFLEGLSRVHNVGVSFSFSGLPVEPVPGVPGSVPFSIALTGEPRDIANFLSAVELKSTKFLVNFNGVTLFADGGAYRADLKGNVYFR